MAKRPTIEASRDYGAKAGKLLKQRDVLTAQMNGHWGDIEAGAADRNAAKIIIALRAIDELRWLRIDVNLRLCALGAEVRLRAETEGLGCH